MFVKLKVSADYGPSNRGAKIGIVVVLEIK